MKAQSYQVCEKDNLFGVCDSSNNVIIPIIYNSVVNCDNFPTWYLVQLKNKSGIINIQNKIVLPIEYEYDMENSNPFNLDGAAYFDSTSLLILKKDGKYGAFKSDFKPIIPFEYDFLGYFYYYSAPAYIAKKKDNYFVMDLEQKILSKTNYTDFANYFIVEGNNSNYAIFKNENKKWVFVDATGKEYSKAFGKTENDKDTIIRKAQPIKYKGKYAAIDYEGNIIGQDYDFMSYFESGKPENQASFAVIGKNMKYGILREDGTEIVKMQYTEIDVIDIRYNMAKVVLNSKLGLVELNTGKEIAAPIYDEIQSNPDISSVKKDNKYALIKNDGKFVTEFIFDDLQLYYDELFGAKQNGKWGYIDHSGKVIIPFQFDRTVGLFSADIVAQEKGGKWGYINSKGETIIPFKYEKAENFYRNSKAEIILNGKSGWVDKQGNETWK
jgi:hypothetical protein